jgi:hypothetical protein
MAASTAMKITAPRGGVSNAFIRVGLVEPAVLMGLLALVLRIDPGVDPIFWPQTAGIEGPHQRGSKTS